MDGRKGRRDTGLDGLQRLTIESEVGIVRMTSRVGASIAAVSGLVALVGVILVSRLDRCGPEWDWRERLSEVLFGFEVDFPRGWALLFVAFAAGIGCAIIALAMGARLEVRRGIAATAILVVIVTTSAVVGVAIGTFLRGCEPIVAHEIRDALFPVGIASLVGAAVGYLTGLAVATIASRRGRSA